MKRPVWQLIFFLLGCIFLVATMWFTLETFSSHLITDLAKAVSLSFGAGAFIGISSSSK